MSNIFYQRDGDLLFSPLYPATGPWDPKFQNGVAMSGLMAHVFETAPAAEGMDLARFHIDILRPAPMAATQVVCTTVRDGRLQVMEAELRVGGELAARASATRIRSAETPAVGLGPPPDPPESLEPRPFSTRRSLRAVLESRLRYGGANELGPGAAWIKLTGQIVEGAPITPFVQAAMVSDFGSGVSSVVDWRAFTFANVDISLNLARAPSGPWVYLEAETVTHGQGRALVNTILSDRDGEFGRAHQTLFIDPRG